MNGQYTAALIYTVALVGGFYLLWWRPQSRQRAALAEMLSSLAPGDEVLTAGGLVGVFRGRDGDLLLVEVADGVVVRMASNAVVGRRVPEQDQEPSDD